MSRRCPGDIDVQRGTGADGARRMESVSGTIGLVDQAAGQCRIRHRVLQRRHRQLLRPEGPRHEQVRPGSELDFTAGQGRRPGRDPDAERRHQHLRPLIESGGPHGPPGSCRSKRPFKIALTAIALVVLAVAAFLWIAGRTAFARNLMADWATEATGLPATVESVTVGFLRGPSIEHARARDRAAAGLRRKPIDRNRQRAHHAPWCSLFGDPVAHAVTIEKAVLRPAVQGGRQRQLVGDDRSPDGRPRTSRPRPPGRSAGSRCSESVLDYEDASTETRFRLSAITIAASDVSPAADFPVELRLGGESGHEHLPARIRRPRAGRHRCGPVRGDRARSSRLGRRRAVAARGRRTDGRSEGADLRQRDERRRGRRAAA